MQSDRFKKGLIDAIKNYDYNYIQNLYVFRYNECLQLYNQVNVMHYLQQAQISCNGSYNEKIVRFWGVIVSINHLEMTKNDTIHEIVNTNKLPRYIMDVITNVYKNEKALLDTYTPLWRTKHSMIVLGIFALSTCTSVFSAYKIAVYLDIKNCAYEFLWSVYANCIDIFSDHQKLGLVGCAFSLLGSGSIMRYLLSQESTKDYVINFYDWSKYKYRNLVGWRKNARTTHEDSVTLCPE